MDICPSPDTYRRTKEEEEATRARKPRSIIGILEKNAIHEV